MMFGRHFKWKSECAFRYIGAVDLRRLDLSDLSVQVATISHRSVGRQTIARNAVGRDLDRDCQSLGLAMGNGGLQD
jgi:hypothetical protein